MTRRLAPSACFAAALLLSATAIAAPSVDEIVKRTNHAAYYQGKDGRAQVTMTITDSQGRKRVRQMTVMRKNAPGKSDGAQRFYVYFHKPADVARTVFMVHKKIGADDDRWLYVPSMDLVKRIAAADQRTSFVGSDFVYEDVSGRSLSADKHELLKTTKSYYVLKHTPKKASRVRFSYYKMWVHKGSYLPTRVIFYDKRGKKYRTMTVDSVEKIQGFHTVTKATMKDLARGTMTTVRYSNVRYNIGLPKRIFTERYLRRAPVKYLR